MSLRELIIICNLILVGENRIFKMLTYRAFISSPKIVEEKSNSKMLWIIFIK